MESLVIKIHTVDGQEHSTRLYLEAGAEAQIFRRLPKEIAAGLWLDDKKTFIPGTAIVRVEIVVGPDVQFPE